MDNKPQTPEHNRDDIDDVLDIMKNRHAKAAEQKSTSGNGVLDKTTVIPAASSVNKAPEKKEAVPENNSTMLHDTVPVKSTFHIQASQTPVSTPKAEDATRVDMDKIKPAQTKKTSEVSAKNTEHQGSTKAISLDDFNTPDVKTDKDKIEKIKVAFLGSVWFGIIKIVLYLCAILMVSSFIAASVIYISNDIFAFVKESEITTQIPYGTSIAGIEKILEDNDIINESIETELRVEVIKNNSRTLAETINTTSVLQPLKDAGITNMHIIDNTNFSITVPKGVDPTVIAELLNKVGAKKVNTDINIVINIPKNATTKDVSKILKKAGVIEYSGIFNIYANYRIGKRSYLTGEYLHGEHVVTPMMNYDKLLDTLSDYERDVSGTVRITIPEGLTADETIDLLVEKGVGRKENYIEALQNFEYDYKFATELTKENLSEYRFDNETSWRLEGYLFPDTYDFYLNENPVSALDKFLTNFNKKFEKEYYERAQELGMTVDEIITLASMIEKEGNNPADYYYISSVFHNRLNSSEFPFLNSDATLQYALAERTDMYNLDTDMDHPYNTYKNRGLPPGPICNPGIQAIDAALYPEKTNYYYFYTKRNGETVFSKTYNEHQRVVNADKK